MAAAAASTTSAVLIFFALFFVPVSRSPFTSSKGRGQARGALLRRPSCGVEMGVVQGRGCGCSRHTISEVLLPLPSTLPSRPFPVWRQRRKGRPPHYQPYTSSQLSGSYTQSAAHKRERQIFRSAHHVSSFLLCRPAPPCSLLSPLMCPSCPLFGLIPAPLLWVLGEYSDTLRGAFEAVTAPRCRRQRGRGHRRPVRGDQCRNRRQRDHPTKKKSRDVARRCWHQPYSHHRRRRVGIAGTSHLPLTSVMCSDSHVDLARRAQTNLVRGRVPLLSTTHHPCVHYCYQAAVSFLHTSMWSPSVPSCSTASIGANGTEPPYPLKYRVVTNTAP